MIYQLSFDGRNFITYHSVSDEIARFAENPSTLRQMKTIHGIQLRFVQPLSHYLETKYKPALSPEIWVRIV